MRLMITGGRGMVGRNLCEHPSASGYDILAPTRAELDLADSSAVHAYVASKKPDMIIHAAGTVGGIQANIEAPVKFLMDNLAVGSNLIMAAREAGVMKVMNIGSSCMYPRDAPNPLSENSILTGRLEPTNEGYALAKIACAKLCAYIRAEDPRFLYKTIVPSNLYGRYDNFHPVRSHMIPAVIRKVHEAKLTGEAVSIWGDGSARREFMLASDLADFVYFAITHYSSMPDMLNVGLGYDYSVLDYYRAVASVVGFTGSFTFDTSKPVGMTQKLMNVDRMEAFGWRAGTNLEYGLTSTYEFFKSEHL
jgi:nucleoside-diphosphate-sugar epimerase